MKTTIGKTTKKEKIVVKIELADKYKNGHDDFSITGSLYEKHKRLNKWMDHKAGCIHDDILRFFPELKIFVDLHLCDWRGVPTFAIANGFYHIENEEKETVQNHFRCSDEELNVLMQAEDETHLKYLVHQLELPEKWKEEANEAIKILEKFTGKTYEPKPENVNHFVPLTDEELKQAEDKIMSGYWDKDSIQERKRIKAEQDKQNKIQSVKDHAQKKIDEIRASEAVEVHILELGYSIDNFIYYNHKNLGVFNWQDSTYRSKMTKEEFNQFLEDVDRSKLPKDIDFELKNN